MTQELRINLGPRSLTRFMASEVPIMEIASDKLLHSFATPDKSARRRTNEKDIMQVCTAVDRLTSCTRIAAVHDVLAHRRQHRLGASYMPT